MGSVNINRSLSDQFYRYKMPRLVAKVEGKGNGIKTVIVNMVDIAKALNRPPTYPTKYFGCEIGAQTYFDHKNERYIVNGSHDASKLQDILDGFIKRFVLCNSCGNPETVLSVNSKKTSITINCSACGYNNQLDTSHKLITFILKNPPDQNFGVNGTNVQTGKKGRRKSREENQQARKTDGNTISNLGSINKNFKENNECGDLNDATPINKQMDISLTEDKGLILNNNLEKTQQERLDLFYEFVKKCKENNCLLTKQIVAEAEHLNIKEKAPLVLCELLLGKNILSELKKNRALFLKFTYNSQKAQKSLLGGFEQVVKMHRDNLMVKVPYILQAFYENDILDEEVILDWANKISKKYVSKEVSQEIHEKALPFIKWLQEAEEESTDEEEQVAFSECSLTISFKDTASDDIDIDAI